MSKSYTELIRIPTFMKRFEYLKVNGFVGDITFGGRRFLNQKFLYESREWRRIRGDIILRDNGCDLAIEDRPIFGSVYIHHINPVTESDILEGRPCVFDPENLICVSFQTHNALHYGNENSISKDYVERRPNDTCLWR